MKNHIKIFMIVIALISFTHTSGQVLSENFDGGGLPAGWNRYGVTNCNLGHTAWKNSSETASTGNTWCGGGCSTGRGGTGYCMYFYNWSVGEAWGVSADSLITPANDLSTYTSATLTFYYYNSNDNDAIDVYAGQSGTGYTLIGTYATTGPAWVPVTINMDAYTGAGFNAVYIKFAGTGDCGASNFAIDDLVLNATCPTIGGTSAATITNVPCGGGNTTLSVSGETTISTYQWQKSTDGGITWNNIIGAITDPYIYNATSTAMYKVLVTNNGCTSSSSNINVTVSICGDIIQPSTGTSNIVISCGGSYNFYDSGGSIGNYSDVENGLITICPGTTGQYVNINFSYDFLNGLDYLYIYDGDDGAANLIGVYTGSGVLTALGNITASSDNSSGCLSFRFRSSSITNLAGWAAVITCVSAPSTPYPTHGIEDCNGAVVICSNSALIGGTSGPGMPELLLDWNSCLGTGTFGENQSQWYVFSSLTNGTIGFEIVPNAPADYDWAVWGPYTSLECPSFTNDVPIRCNGTTLIANGNTGLVAPATDIIEQNGIYPGEVTDADCKPLDVLAGDIYIMMLDNWTNSNIGFQLNWTLTNGATLDCSPPLPVTLTKFESTCINNRTILNWSTETELNNNFFIIEKSDDDFNFYEIGKVFGAGTSNYINNYSFEDVETNNKTTYYRLVQVDFDGSVKYHRIIASNCHDNLFNVVKTNLTNTSLDLLITTSKKEKINISLYNSIGQLITSKDEIINNGSNTISLNININSGIYLLSINGTYNKHSSKIFTK